MAATFQSSGAKSFLRSSAFSSNQVPVAASSGDVTKIFDEIEEALNQIAYSVERTTVAVLRLTTWTRWSVHPRPGSLNGLHEDIGVVALVLDDCFLTKIPISSFTHEMSASCPSVATNRRGRSASSPARCRLVLNPPRERPSTFTPFG